MQIWPGEISEHKDIMDELIALQPTQLRFSFGPTWRKSPMLRTDMTNDELDAYVAAGYYGVKNIEKMRDTLISARDATNALLNLIIWDGPRMPGDVDFDDPGVSQSRVLTAENTKLLARFHVANFRFLRSFGLWIDAVELSNEPDGKWNMQISPPLYLDMIQSIRSEAHRRQVELPQIYGPGASRAEAARYMFDDDKVARGIIDNVDVVSLHAWDDHVGKDQGEELDKLIERVHQLGREPKIAVTEFALSRPDLNDDTLAMDAGRRVTNSITQQPRYVAESTRELLRIFERNVVTVIYWEFKDQTWGDGLYGLLDSQTKRKPIFDLFEKVGSLLRRGSYELRWTQDENTFNLRSKNNYESTIVINRTPKERAAYEAGLPRVGANTADGPNQKCMQLAPYSIGIFTKQAEAR